ncbi:MAG: hypothetical protein ACFB51_19670 [Anaerolineae bacterium]
MTADRSPELSGARRSAADSPGLARLHRALRDQSAALDDLNRSQLLSLLWREAGEAGYRQVALVFAGRLIPPGDQALLDLHAAAQDRTDTTHLRARAEHFPPMAIALGPLNRRTTLRELETAIAATIRRRVDAAVRPPVRAAEARHQREALHAVLSDPLPHTDDIHLLLDTIKSEGDLRRLACTFARRVMPLYEQIYDDRLRIALTVTLETGGVSTASRILVQQAVATAGGLLHTETGAHRYARDAAAIALNAVDLPPREAAGLAATGAQELMAQVQVDRAAAQAIRHEHDWQTAAIRAVLARIRATKTDEST